MRVDEAVRSLSRGLSALEERLVGDERRALVRAQGPISIMRRLNVVDMGIRWSTYGPTPTHKQSLDIARSAFADLRIALEKLVRTDLPALERQLEAAGVPWSPGRR